jgi:hypothetical protein
MAGRVVLYRSEGLEEVPTPRVEAFLDVPCHGGEQVEGFVATYLGGALWLQIGRRGQLPGGIYWQVRSGHEVPAGTLRDLGDRGPVPNSRYCVDALEQLSNAVDGLSLLGSDGPGL